MKPFFTRHLIMIVARNAYEEVIFQKNGHNFSTTTNDRQRKDVSQKRTIVFFA